MKVKFKKLNPRAQLPSYAYPGDSGMDLHVCFGKKGTEISLRRSEVILVPTGLSMELPPGYEAQIRPKSGLAISSSITVLNSPGTIDFAYRGEICIIIINHASWSFTIKDGMKIAQMVIKPIEQAEIEEVQELSNTERGEGGFGSSGI